MALMKAVSLERYGNVDVLQYGDTLRPTPGAGEVLIRAQATSVNPFDCAVRAGMAHMQNTCWRVLKKLQPVRNWWNLSRRQPYPMLR
jgi:NADPH:quinone reductase-like Zn-dependent oxidoreductase